MTTTDDKPRTRCGGVCSAEHPQESGWRQARPELSLKLIRRIGIPRSAGVIDIGGAASTLADQLLADGFSDLAVLVGAAAGLDRAKLRLGARAAQVAWIIADITRWRPTRTFELWHDRAVLHSLTDPLDQSAYAEALRVALAADGWAVLGGFPADGPFGCGAVARNAASVGALLGEGFALMEEHGEVRVAPGREHTCRYYVFQRRRRI